jgi:hypothetical protein
LATNCFGELRCVVAGFTLRHPGGDGFERVYRPAAKTQCAGERRCHNRLSCTGVRSDHTEDARG